MEKINGIKQEFTDGNTKLAYQKINNIKDDFIANMNLCYDEEGNIVGDELKKF